MAKLNKFIVNGALTVSCWTEVWAETEEQALDIVEDRNPSSMCYGALSENVDESWHFENDGEPYDLKVEDTNG